MMLSAQFLTMFYIFMQYCIPVIVIFILKNNKYVSNKKKKKKLLFLIILQLHSVHYASVHVSFEELSEVCVCIYLFIRRLLESILLSSFFFLLSSFFFLLSSFFFLFFFFYFFFFYNFTVIQQELYICINLRNLSLPY